MKGCLKDNNGSFTIEAAIIIPFIVIVLTAVIFLSFFLYDKCSLERAAAMAALRGSQEVWEDNNIRYQKADEGIKAVLEANLLGTNCVEKHVEVKGNQVCVLLKMQYKWWDFSAQAEKQAVNPITFIRNCRKAEGVIEKQK